MDNNVNAKITVEAKAVMPSSLSWWFKLVPMRYKVLMFDKFIDKLIKGDYEIHEIDKENYKVLIFKTEENGN
jgi:hypothetical protein